MLATMMLGCGAAQTHAQCFEEQKLTASDATQYDYFGKVSVSGDTVVVGAAFDDDRGAYSGSVYIFGFDGTSWVEEQKLTASDAAEYDYFGTASVSGDTVVVGASGDDDGGVDSGSAYTFRFDGTSWVENQKLTASDAAERDHFGNSVSVSGDTAIVGADGNDDGGEDSGSAYIFRFDGTSWVEEQKLTASDAAEHDHFGNSVSVSGNTVVVGAALGDDGGVSSGSAFIFRFDGMSWVEEQKLTASDAAQDDLFGNSVFVSGDTVVVGASYNDDGGTNSGSAYIYSCNFTGACCIGTGCSMGTEIACFHSGGTFFGLNSSCDSPDADGDGLRDECDECPDDGGKTDPGVCGCGLDDNADADDDGVPDCTDQCPSVDDAFFAPECMTAIPTVSAWGLVVLTLLVSTAGKLAWSRRTTT